MSETRSNETYQPMTFDAIKIGLASPEKIRECAKALTEAMQEPFICVQGSEEKIKSNAALFNEMVTLF